MHRTGLGDTIYKCQIKPPVDSDCVTPTLSHSISLPSLPLLGSLSSGDLELSLRRRAASDKKADRARGFRLLMTVAKMFYFFSLEVTNRKRNVHEAAMNHAPLASVQSLSCLHSPGWDWQPQFSFSKRESKNVSNVAEQNAGKAIFKMTGSLHSQSFYSLKERLLKNADFIHTPGMTVGALFPSYHIRAALYRVHLHQNISRQVLTSHTLHRTLAVLPLPFRAIEPPERVKGTKREQK